MVSLVSLVSRIGRKYTIYLPKKVVEELGISEGDPIIISVRDNKIIIRPVRRFLRKKKYWSRTTAGEVEKNSEEITQVAEED